MLYAQALIDTLCALLRTTFKIHSADAISVEMRLSRLGDAASSFSAAPLASLPLEPWKPIRQGFTVFDRANPYFAYKAANNTDTLHRKQQIIRTLCI